MRECERNGVPELNLSGGDAECSRARDGKPGDGRHWDGRDRDGARARTGVLLENRRESEAKEPKKKDYQTNRDGFQQPLTSDSPRHDAWRPGVQMITRRGRWSERTPPASCIPYPHTHAARLVPRLPPHSVSPTIRVSTTTPSPDQLGRPANLAPALLARRRPFPPAPLAPALAPSIFAHGLPDHTLSLLLRAPGVLCGGRNTIPWASCTSPLAPSPGPIWKKEERYRRSFQGWRSTEALPDSSKQVPSRRADARGRPSCVRDSQVFTIRGKPPLLVSLGPVSIISLASHWLLYPYKTAMISLAIASIKAGCYERPFDLRYELARGNLEVRESGSGDNALLRAFFTWEGSESVSDSRTRFLTKRQEVETLGVARCSSKMNGCNRGPVVMDGLYESSRNSKCRRGLADISEIRREAEEGTLRRAHDTEYSVMVCVKSSPTSCEPWERTSSTAGSGREGHKKDAGGKLMRLHTLKTVKSTAMRGLRRASSPGGERARPGEVWRRGVDGQADMKDAKRQRRGLDVPATFTNS
ncbi:hypothetical protein C8R47DRAFT_1082748 [Mycena vitilis]|nr:hypothetical protein C8R47DRAFT_1082748 [Mycena vitilis]